MRMCVFIITLVYYFSDSQCIANSLNDELWEDKENSENGNVLLNVIVKYKYLEFSAGFLACKLYFNFTSFYKSIDDNFFSEIFVIFFNFFYF